MKKAGFTAFLLALALILPTAPADAAEVRKRSVIQRINDKFEKSRRVAESKKLKRENERKRKQAEQERREQERRQDAGSAPQR